MRLSDDLVGCASHTGHLEKRGQKNKDLKRRYFLLHGATLSYFESEDGAKKAKPKPKGQLTVVSVGHAKNSDLPEMDQSEVRGGRSSDSAGFPFQPLTTHHSPLATHHSSTQAGQTLIGNSISSARPTAKPSSSSPKPPRKRSAG